MKKRVGFQFNALEDTVESIGLEMVEQLALNPFQVWQHVRQLTAAAASRACRLFCCSIGASLAHMGQAPRADCA
jgi:hypothetical protein